MMVNVLFTWQGALAAGIMLIASSIYLIKELKIKGLMIALVIPVLAGVLLAITFATPEQNQGGFVSSSLGGIILVFLSLTILPIFLNVSAGVMAVRKYLTTRMISPMGWLPIASGALGILLLGSTWFSMQWQESVYSAIRMGDLRKVQRLVWTRFGANGTLLSFEEYPLHLAAKEGNPSITAFLLKKGADASRVNKKGQTALSKMFEHDSDKWECGPGCDDVATLLIESGSPITSNDMENIFNLKQHARSVAAIEKRLITPSKIAENGAELAAFLECVIFSGENQIIERFLSAGGNINFRTANGDPLILLAFQGGNDAFAQQLMKCGADTSVSTQPPKIEDIEKQVEVTDGRDYLGRLNADTVRMFFQKNPNLRMNKDFPYTPPLQQAAERGNVEVMSILFEKGSDVAVKHYGETALHGAIEENKIDAVRWLVAHGADINLAREYFDESPLVMACQKDTPEIALFLVSKGARLSGSELHEACSRGFIDLASALIRRGADINAVDSENRTVLDRAVEEDQLETVRWLTNHGANINPTKDRGESPLMEACSKNTSEMALFLLSKGAQPRGSEFHEACSRGFTDLASALILHGVNVNAMDSEDRTALYLAVEGGHLETVRWLITQGADINLTKDGNESPLQYACKLGTSEMALFLLSNGALLRGSELQYACRSGSIDVASALIRHGADVNAVNYESMTPVEVAIKYEQPEMEKFLITQGAKPSHHSRLY